MFSLAQADNQGDLLDNLDANAFQSRNFLRVVCHQPDLITADAAQHCGGNLVFTFIVAVAQGSIGIHRVQSRVLQQIGSKACWSGPMLRPLLREVEQNAVPVLAHRFHGCI